MMSALSMILQPTVEPVPKQEAEETIDVRASKRRKSDSPSEKGQSSTPDRLVKIVKDERKQKWLAGLSHNELLGVAQGAVWQIGGLHNKNCFSCKKGGTLLECHNCPRSYHRRCLDPPIHGNFKIDQPWFCPNCVLLQLEPEDLNPPEMARSVSEQEKPLAKLPLLRIGNVTPLHRSPESNLARLVPKGHLPSKARTPLPEMPDRPHKRSRYTTLPEHVEEALGLLNRELETAFHSKGLLKDMASKYHALEQELQIRKGQEVLMAREQERDVSPSREVLESLRREMAGLKRENGSLREELEKVRVEMERKEKEAEEWKASMKKLIDGS